MLANPRQAQVPEGILRIQRERPARVGLGAVEKLHVTMQGVAELSDSDHRQHRVGRCKPRIQLDRTLQQTGDFQNALGAGRSENKVARSHEEIPGRRVGGGPLALPVQKLHLQGVGDLARDVRLDLEDIGRGELALVALAPDVHVRGRVDQLGDDSHPVPRATHAPLDDVGHTQLASDLLQVGGLALVARR